MFRNGSSWTKLIKKTSRRDNMKILKNCVILTLGEYEEYKRMKACISELQSKKTDFIQPPTEEVEA